MHRELIYLPQDISPILTIVVHTEEEFEWSKGFNRKSVGTRHIRRIHAVQDIFDEYSIKPTYVVDYPIASQQEAIETLKEYSDSGRAEIGAHLHPWVTPPFEEEVNAYNSYPGNLPRELEFAKLARLTQRIHESFGIKPKSYLAGRYGYGPNTGATLRKLDYEVDISAAPPIDFGYDGGPDYSTYTSHPFWLDQQHQLLGLPGTGAYVGALKSASHRLYRVAVHPQLRWAHLPGIMSRLRLFERLRLSPEGYNQQELMRLTRTLLNEGIRHFVFSFHSPSVMPCCTPYVRNESDLGIFLGCCEEYCDFFLNNLKGVAMSALEFKRYLEKLTDLAPGPDITGKHRR